MLAKALLGEKAWYGPSRNTSSLSLLHSIAQGCDRPRRCQIGKEGARPHASTDTEPGQAAWILATK